MEPSLCELYGSPERVVSVLGFRTPGEVEIKLQLFNKTATRLAEAMYFSFRPPNAGQMRWSMEKLGGWVDPLDVAQGASKGLHCVTRVKAEGAGGSLELETPDAALARWDQPLPFPTPLHRQPDLAQGFHMMLFNNIWNTNYPFWFPFEPQDKDLQFRFKLSLGA